MFPLSREWQGPGDSLLSSIFGVQTTPDVVQFVIDRVAAIPYGRLRSCSQHARVLFVLYFSLVEAEYSYYKAFYVVVCCSLCGLMHAT